MKVDDLNKYILHYLTKDKTGTAILLTGRWGSGKSYYINTVLKPFLEENKKKCVVVSLYGLNTVEEIGKSIYWGLRSLKLKFDNEKLAAGALAAQTLAKGFTSFFGVDLQVDDNALQKLYESIDLSDKLVVLEDLERTNIDTSELLGYVNNMTEHDKAKVLLVANEDEIIKTKAVEEEDRTEFEQFGKKKTQRYDYTDETKKYLLNKEKTVSDTILFEGDYRHAIVSIASLFENVQLSQLCAGEGTDDVKAIMDINGNYNLRSFIFACQKTADLFEYIKDDRLSDLRKCIFYSVVAFSFKMNKGSIVSWNDENEYSFDLGTSKYPLFKFCYDYITYHHFEPSKIAEADEQLRLLRLYDKKKTKNDKDIVTLQEYYRRYESDVKEAVDSITRRLNIIEDISFFDYGTIITYLIIVKHALGIDIEEAKKQIIDNLRGRGKDIPADALFKTTLRYESEEIQEEFKEVRKQIYSILNEDELIPGFSYKPSQSGQLLEFVRKNELLFHSKERFLGLLDVQKFVDMFKSSSPMEMDDLRGVFGVIYGKGHTRSFFASDIPLLIEMKNNIETYYQEGSITDKVQKLQTEWFIDNLNEYIQQGTS